MVPGTYVQSFVKIGLVTAEILLTLSLVWWVVVVGGGGGGWRLDSEFSVHLWAKAFGFGLGPS